MTVADGKAPRHRVRAKVRAGQTLARLGRKDREPRPGEARARRHEADVFETSSHRIEGSTRAPARDFHTPVLRDIVAEAFPRATGSTSRPLRVLRDGWNTKLVKGEELPRLRGPLHPRWTGRITIEGTDVLWFAA